MKLPVYNASGQHVAERELPENVFGVPARPTLIQQAVVAQLANKRVAIAHTKTRSDVRGGGRKPWKQKGTGRARHGSIRSPLWKGGGVTFGPRKTRNFSVLLNAKARRKALRMALSDKVSQKHVVLIDALTLPNAKTRALVALLSKLPLAPKKAKELSVLTVVPETSPSLVRASRNLPGVHTIRADSLNVVAILRHDYLLMPEQTVDVIAKTYGGSR